MSAGPTEPVPIELLDLASLHAPIRAELDAALGRVLDGAQFALGAEVSAFEEEFAAYVGAPFAIGCASGSDALMLGLIACGVRPGDEVICPAFSFFATASAITRLGARPVFADIEPSTFVLDPDHVRHLAEECTHLRAILPVDLYGRVCEMSPLREWARDNGIALIEDAAQAVGARDGQSRGAGTHADVGCFSFYPSKNLGAIGEAGMLVTGDPERAARLRSLRVHGEREPYRHVEVGLNSRLDAIQAAVLRVKLHHLEEWTKTRIENAAHYDDVFLSLGARHAAPGDARPSGALPVVLSPGPGSPARHVYHQYVVRVPANRREGLRAHLASQRIATGVYYPIPLHRQPCFRSLPAARPSLPECERAATESLALPVHPNLGPREIERVAGEVARHLRR